MSDEVITEFKRNEFFRTLVDTLFNVLLDEDNKGPFSSTFVRAALGPIPESTVVHTAPPVLFLMINGYAELRTNGKNHCESLIGAQNYLVDFAYNAVSGTSIEDDVPSLQLTAKTLKEYFGNVKAYIGGDAKDYAKFLGKVTHDALRKTHPNCKGLDENLLDINKRYSL